MKDLTLYVPTGHRRLQAGLPKTGLWRTLLAKNFMRGLMEEKKEKLADEK